MNNLWAKCQIDTHYKYLYAIDLYSPLVEIIVVVISI